MNGPTKEWDVFICHASEDKEAFVRPLATALAQLGLKVWYDEFTLKIGDSLSRSIDKGLVSSRFGIVVLSQWFFAKKWTERELRGLVALEIDERQTVLPIWHGVTKQQVLDFSPPLADVFALDTTRDAIGDITLSLLYRIRPDLYTAHPRPELLRIASGQALEELKSEVEQKRAKVKELEKALEQYGCPTCAARGTEQYYDSLFVEEEEFVVFAQLYDCGCKLFDRHPVQLCPHDPEYPPFEDFELSYIHRKPYAHGEYLCQPKGKTKKARQVEIQCSWRYSVEDARRSALDSYLYFLRRAGVTPPTKQGPTDSGTSTASPPSPPGTPKE